MKKSMIYGCLTALCYMASAAADFYDIAMHADISPDKEYILCTNSGNDGVDCGVFAVDNNKPSLICSTYIHNNDIVSFTYTIGSFLIYLKEQYNIDVHSACFAGPGVPSRDHDYLTHIRLPYVIDAKEIKATYHLQKAVIVNDFLALSYGIDFSDDTQIIPLHDIPAETHGKKVIIGAGNGLGTVVMMWDECQHTYVGMPAEAGTGDFPAQNQFEFDLAMKMKKMRKMDTVHWANFVSLSGIQYMYEMLRTEEYAVSDVSVHDPMTILAAQLPDSASSLVTDLFYTFYARFVYNLVWTTLPFGGIYLIGDTAAQYPEKLKTIFMSEYFNCVVSKRPLLERIPVYIMKDDKYTGLYGAAHYFVKNMN